MVMGTYPKGPIPSQHILSDGESHMWLNKIKQENMLIQAPNPSAAAFLHMARVPIEPLIPNRPSLMTSGRLAASGIRPASHQAGGDLSPDPPVQLAKFTVA